MSGRVALLAVALLAALPAYADDAPLSYQRDLRDIFQRHCVSCHSGWFPSAGLRLDSLENILEGGQSGPAVVPGRADKGWLPFALSQEQGRYRMPPLPARIEPAERQRILDWIAQGARP